MKSVGLYIAAFGYSSPHTTLSWSLGEKQLW